MIDNMIRNVRAYKMYDDVVLPEYATDQSACFDLRGYFPLGTKCKLFQGHNDALETRVHEDHGDSLCLWDGETVLIPTGLIFDIEEGYSIRLHSRSGLSIKRGLILANGEGVIDSDYINETFIMIRNVSGGIQYIKHGERIAQGEIVPVHQVHFETIDMPPVQKTTRDGGFGSTGTH